MHRDKNILAVIPARGGSKRLPGKNIKLLGDKPLIAWTIEAAQRSRLLDRIVLSSENQEIISTVKGYGLEVPIVRSSQLASDQAPSENVLERAMNSIDKKFYYTAVLQQVSLFELRIRLMQLYVSV